MIPERALDGREIATADGQDAGRRLIPFSVKVNRILLAAAFSVLLLLGAGMVWSQTGAGSRFAAPEPEGQLASLTIETPTPTRERVMESTPTISPTGEVALETIEAAKPTATVTLNPREATPATTEVISRTRQVAMRALSTPATSARRTSGAAVKSADGEGTALELGAGREAEGEDGKLPSTGVSLWLPIQGVAVMALLFFWRELRWHRTGR